MKELIKKGAWVTPLLAMSLAVAPAAEAQTMVTVQGGATFATFEGDDADIDGVDPGTRTGFNFGASLGLPISEIIYLTPGLYYVQKGAEYEEAGLESAIELTYLEVPILLQVMLTGPDRPLGLSVFAGPSLAFEIGCDISFEELSGDCDDEGEIETKSLDIGALFGAGVSFPVGERVALLVNGGMDLGLTSIDDSAADNDVKNSTFFLNVGLGFPLGR